MSLLGNIVFSDGYAIAPGKKAANRDWQTPVSLGELRSFIGTCTFLKIFALSLSAIASPLYAAAARSTFDWNPKGHQEFEAVKALFLSAPVLHHADGNHPFIVSCDASNFSITSALLQADNEGVERPLGYFSKKLSAEELTTMIYDKKLMAVVEPYPTGDTISWGPVTSSSS